MFYFEHSSAHPRRSGGFSLVELAVVFVVIGLIISAAFYGKEVKEKGESKAVLSEMSGYMGSLDSFRSKYHYLAGDLPQSGRYFSGAAVVPSANGNHQWDLAAERDGAFPQMHQAGMVKTDVSGSERPDSRISGAKWTVLEKFTVSPPSGGTDITYHNVLRIGREDGGSALDGGALKVKTHRYIDSKIDGVNTPLSGKYIAGHVELSAPCVTAAGGRYVYVDDQDIRCTGNIVDRGPEVQAAFDAPDCVGEQCGGQGCEYECCDNVPCSDPCEVCYNAGLPNALCAPPSGTDCCDAEDCGGSQTCINNECCAPPVCGAGTPCTDADDVCINPDSCNAECVCDPALECCDDSQCGGGQTCQNNVCDCPLAGQCNDDSDCEPDATCEGSTGNCDGVCLPDDGNTTYEVGCPCASDDDCGGLEQDGTWVYNYCLPAQYSNSGEAGCVHYDWNSHPLVVIPDNDCCSAAAECCDDSDCEADEYCWEAGETWAQCRCDFSEVECCSNDDCGGKICSAGQCVCPGGNKCTPHPDCGCPAGEWCFDNSHPEYPNGSDRFPQPPRGICTSCNGALHPDANGNVPPQPDGTCCPACQGYDAGWLMCREWAEPDNPLNPPCCSGHGEPCFDSDPDNNPGHFCCAGLTRTMRSWGDGTATCMCFDGCSDAGEPCLQDSNCCGSNTCNLSTRTCEGGGGSCAPEGQACTANPDCCAGLECSGGTCSTSSGSGSCSCGVSPPDGPPCCVSCTDNSDCDPNLVCVSGSCR